MPHQLATALKKRGQRAIHASELPVGNLSTDNAIIEYANLTDAIVVSKDADFIAAYQVKGMPQRLLYVTTGNIRNTELIFVFMSHLDLLCEKFNDGGLVEMDRNGIIVR